MSGGVVIGVVGTTPNIGTTTAAFAMACRVAERAEGKVGFLCLNLKSAKLHRYLGVDRPTWTLDSLRPELRANALLPEMLLRAAHRSSLNPNLHVVFGNVMRDQAEFYEPEDINRLLAAARTAFAVTIADVSAYWDNAATIAVQKLADSRILTTTSALSDFQEDCKRWIGQVSPMFDVSAEHYETVVLFPPWRIGGFQMKDIRKETGLKMAGALRLPIALSLQLDQGQLEQWLKEDKQGKAAMSDLSERLINRHHVLRKTSKHAQPWYRKLLEHRNEVRPR